MRFRFPSLAPDTVSAEEVRAVREGRGWTAEELADAVHASPLEVSAWEAGTVRVPPEQAERIRWLMEVDAWISKVAWVRVEPCDWVRENAPRLYDTMFADVAGTWYTRNAAVREHVAGCATCQRMWERAEWAGGRPPAPGDAPDTWRTRYRRWTRRFPRWLRTPLNLLGDLPELAVIALFVTTVPDAHSGLPARVFGVSLGALTGLLVLRSTAARLEESTRPRMAGVLAGLAGSVVGLIMWSLTDAAVDLRDPRLWAGSAAVGVAVGLIRARSARYDADPRPALAWKVERAALGAPDPLLDPHVHARPAAEPAEAARPGGR